MTTTVDQLTERLTRLLADSRLTYHEGAVSVEDGELRWVRPGKTLIFTITPQGNILYLKVRGPHTTFEEGENPSDAQIVELWKWLYPEVVVV